LFLIGYVFIGGGKRKKEERGKERRNKGRGGLIPPKTWG